MPLERYSDRWQDYKKAEKDGDKQLVFSKIAAYAKRLDEKIAKFSSDYQEAREKAYEKKEAYDWLVKHLVKDDKVDSLQDIRTEAFKLGDSEFKKYDADTGEIYKATNGFTDHDWHGKYEPITDDMYNLPTAGYIEKD